MTGGNSWLSGFSSVTGGNSWLSGFSSVTGGNSWLSGFTVIDSLMSGFYDDREMHNTVKMHMCLLKGLF